MTSLKKQQTIKCCKMCAGKYFGNYSKCFGKPSLPICKVSSCPKTKKSIKETRKRRNEHLKWKRLKNKEDAAKETKKKKKWFLFN